MTNTIDGNSTKTKNSSIDDNSLDSNSIDIVMFGAAGDLAARKLFPALLHLESCQLLPKNLRIICLGRELKDDVFMDSLKDKIRPLVNDNRWSESLWAAYAERFHCVAMDFADYETYQSLSTLVSETHTKIFYLATASVIFETICEHLHSYRCLEGDSRIVVEKPIGNDLESCEIINETMTRYFDESRIYRIDHYLGKETVQNLLVLRFANRFINTQWDQSCIDHVQITVAETVGIEDRWGYYDQVGQLRDMVQNHLMQLLCLVAMEPPNSMTAQDIRQEKVKIIRALRSIDDSNVEDHLVLGRYEAGWQKGQAVPGYLQESGCQNPNSQTETYVAIKAFIDNWRWSGVPFYLRTGKRLPEKVTEIVIAYKSLPHNIFSDGETIPNRLVIRLQPNEGIEMQMVSKLHSLKNKMNLSAQNLNLDFLGTSGMDRIPDAYERLFLDVINGDQSLFVGREEVEESWRWCDTMLQAAGSQGISVNTYQAGGWGPIKSELLIEKDERSWHVS